MKHEAREPSGGALPWPLESGFVAVSCVRLRLPWRLSQKYGLPGRVAPFTSGSVTLRSESHGAFTAPLQQLLYLSVYFYELYCH